MLSLSAGCSWHFSRVCAVRLLQLLQCLAGELGGGGWM